MVDNPRRLQRYERRGEELPEEPARPSEGKKEIKEQAQAGAELKREKLAPKAVLSDEYNEEEMAADLEEQAGEGGEETREAKPVTYRGASKEEMAREISKRAKLQSQEEAEKDIAKKELDKFKDKFKRMPMTEKDYDESAQTVFEQVQLRGEEGVFEKAGEKKAAVEEKEIVGEEKGHRIRRRREAAQEQAPREEAGESIEQPGLGAEESEEKMSVKELFGKKKGKTAKAAPEEESEELGEGLEEMESEEGEEGLSLEELEEGKEICPNCEKPTEEVIYCPKCGAAFCDACPKSKEQFADKVKYTCPHCDAKIDRPKKQSS